MFGFSFNPSVVRCAIGGWWALAILEISQSPMVMLPQRLVENIHWSSNLTQNIPKIFIDHLIISSCMFFVPDLLLTCPGPVISDFGNKIIQAGWKILIGQIDFHLRQILGIERKIMSSTSPIYHFILGLYYTYTYCYIHNICIYIYINYHKFWFNSCALQRIISNTNKFLMFKSLGSILDIFYLPTTSCACKSGSGSNSLQTWAGLIRTPIRVMAATNFDYFLRNHGSK